VSEDAPLDRLAKVHRKIRAAQLELKHKYEAEDGALEEQRKVVADAIKTQLLRLGVKSVNTLQGTIMLQEKRRYYTQDWDSFKQFCREHDALDLFEKRIAQGNMSTFLQANPKLFPPGLNVDAEYVVSVRKPSA